MLKTILFSTLFCLSIWSEISLADSPANRAFNRGASANDLFVNNYGGNTMQRPIRKSGNTSQEIQDAVAKRNEARSIKNQDNILKTANDAINSHLLKMEKELKKESKDGIDLAKILKQIQ